MSSITRRGFTVAAVLAALSLPSLSLAQCNLTNPPCTAACTNAPCGGSVIVGSQSQNVCSVFGAAPPIGQTFDLTTTLYANTCHGSLPLGGSGCAQAAILPPFRLWGLNNYKTANSGCQDQVAGNVAGNVTHDVFGAAAVPAGHWFIFTFDWLNAKTDGCLLSVGNPPAVIEVSDVLPAPAEGSINHGSWFAIAQVPVLTGTSTWDTDQVTGVPPNAGCPGGKDIPAAALGTAILGGRATTGTGTGACRGDATATQLPSTSTNAVDLTFFDVPVTLQTPAVTGYSDAGATTSMIAGFQIVFATGSEPTSSNYFTGNWTPAHDTANPAMRKGVIPVGTAATTITLPKGALGTDYWIAARIVYADTSLNTNLNACTAGTDCPTVVSDVSAHCGPVEFSGSTVAVEFANVKAVRSGNGVEVSWTTLSEDDTLGFRVFRANNAQGTDAEAAISMVTAAGRPSSYSAVDAAAGPSEAWYYVQEITSNGFGDRSVSVKAESAAASAGSASGAAGGRSRAKRR